MKKLENACCRRWGDISNPAFQIAVPQTFKQKINGRTLYGIAPMVFDKRRIRYCLECGRLLN